MTITVIISTAIMLFCLIFHKGILSLFFGSIETDVMNACISYFLITALSFPFLGIYNSSSALFRSIEKTKVTMYVSLLMNAINIIGNYIGVIILGAGVVGQCVGANDYEQAAYYIKKLMKISYVVTAVIDGLVIIVLPWLLNLYTLSDEARSFTYILVIMHSVMAFALHSTSFVLPNGMRAAGDVKYSMYVGIVSMLIFRLGSAVLFGIVLNMGIIGVWIAMGADWLFRFTKGKWKQFKAI